MMRDCCDATTAPSLDGFVGSEGDDVEDDEHPATTASEDAARRRRWEALMTARTSRISATPEELAKA
jgi:hypothetical protein